MKCDFHNRENVQMEPVETVIVLNGTLKGIEVRLLKEDGCDTKFISSSLVRSQNRVLT